MKDNYDFSKAIKNPFSGRKKGEYTVKIHYNFNNNDKQNSVINKTGNNESAKITSTSKLN